MVLVPMLGDPCREQRLLVGVRVLVLVAMLGDPCREQWLLVGVRVLVLVLVAMLLLVLVPLLLLWICLDVSPGYVFLNGCHQH